MASSSSLSLSRSCLYDVFLSFRGVDVRKGFLSHVRERLESKGIIAFVDDNMKRGESIDAELIGAIRQSRVAVVLFSRNYASSSWCLDELLEIMKCRKENQQTVLTIFYEVNPSDVRDQTGNFGKAFDETCVGKTEEVKQAWRQALKDVAGLAGYHSSNFGSEADLINKVASEVTDVLGFTPSKDFDDFVGIGDHIIEIKLKLILQSEEVKVIAILGPAGIGKTTTARVLFDQLSHGFPFNTFLEDIRGNYEKPCGNDYQLKLRLQKNLLSEIFNQKDIEVRHLGVAQQMLSDKKVLVVLDEVDSWWQLEEMAKQRGWFAPGSIIIITTEDRKPLRQLGLGINHIYKMKFPTKDESLEIFCQYAFGQKSPPDYGFEELAKEVTGLAGDLPLGLKVMGSYLRGMSRDEWIEARPRLRSSLDSEIESTLKFSYDGLNVKDQALFLYIACFFSEFYYTLEVDRLKICLEKGGLDINHGLQILVDKSLISLEYGSVRMHSLLQKLGREIVKKEYLKEPGKRQFLWDTNEISDLLQQNTGTGNVIGIMLDTSEGGEVQISKSAFDGMYNLQFLKVSSEMYNLQSLKVSSDKLCIPDGLNCLPGKLRLLHWENCPLEIWPTKFSGKFLVELTMRNSKFEKLWEDIQPLQCLKLMDLSQSQYLKEIPDLSEATGLEELDLCGCKSLLELTSSIGNATKLRVCKLSGCKLLKELPSSIGKLVNLEELDLSECKSLLALNIFSSLEKLSGCSSLKKLNLSYTEIEEMPLSISTWSCLYRLDITGCTHIKDFPNVSASIVELWLSKTGIEEVPQWIEKLFHLRRLIMTGCEKLKTISPNISKLENLEDLSLSFCDTSEKDYRHTPTGRRLFLATIEWGYELKKGKWSLHSDFDVHYILPTCLPQKALSSPVSLSFYGDGLKTLPDCISPMSGLSKLDISCCKNLVALPPLPGSLLSIDAQGFESLESIDSSFFQNPKNCLNFANCFKLNQEARRLIQTSACKYAVLPGEEVSIYFPHQGIPGLSYYYIKGRADSLTISLTPRPLPSSVRFKACILLSLDIIYFEDHKYDDDDDEDFTNDMYCHISGKQNGLTVQYGPVELHHFPTICQDHLYIFEDSVSLNEDCPEAEEVTSSELCFKFGFSTNFWVVQDCGVRILEVPQEKER